MQKKRERSERCTMKNRMNLAVSLVVGFALMFAATFAGQAEARELVIAFRGDAATLDPHLRSENTTWNFQSHIFDYLFNYDADGEIRPHLATSLERVNDTTWLLHLRQGVKFHNGEPFNAKAAAYSLTRAKIHPRSQMAYWLASVDQIEAVDEYTVRLTTVGPRPLLLMDLTQSIMMVPPQYIEEVGDAEFERRPVGTGAYKFVEWVRDQHLILEVNPDWWGWEGREPAITRVVMRPIPEAATRVAALLTGEVHVAESITIEDLPRVEMSPDHYVARVPSQRVIYLTMDYWREKGSHGMGPNEPNPFMDPRVRRAVAHAINVDDIVQYVMGGAAYPANQFIHPNAYGYNPNIVRPEYNPEKARELLAEAGYPNGFTVRLDAPNDRYINDAEIAQAIAGQLRQVGINVNVNLMPRAEFFPRIDRGDFTMYLAGWGSINISSILNSQLRCRDPERGLGHANRIRFCSPAFDTLVSTADITFDDEERLELYHEAIRLALEDYVVWVPIHYEEIVMGIDARFQMKPRFDEMIYAYEVTLRD